MKTITYEPEFLKKFSEEHLLYELNTFFISLGYLARYPNHAPDIWIEGLNNILIESYTIHLRNLYYFFFCDTPMHADDALAVHFFKNSHSWKNIRPSISEDLKLCIKRVGKEIAHLTYYRNEVTETANDGIFFTFN